MNGDRFFIYPYLGAGRAAVAVQVFRELKTVGVGVAWCSPKDQFNRKMGRRIAEGRLLRAGNMYYELPYSGEPTRKQIVEQVVNTITFADAPQWALDALERH